MATNHSNFVGMRRVPWVRQLKNRQKSMIFAFFCPGLPNGVANYSAPCGSIWLKFCVANRLVYGYKLLKFRWDASRYVGAAIEKPSKIEDFCRFLPGVAQLSGQLLVSLWADLAEILHGKRARIWL